MTFIISFGKYGGFYHTSNRICLGWVAITFFGADLDPLIEQFLDWKEMDLGQYARRLKQELEGFGKVIRVNSAGNLAFCTVSFLEAQTAPVEILKGSALSASKKKPRTISALGFLMGIGPVSPRSIYFSDR